jgi:hypothetical protein
MLSIKDQDARSAAREIKPRDKLELERRYGSIGIPAVAAAARYHDARRNPPTAASATTVARRFDEPAA